jgi:hypothetical protein
LSTLIFGGDKVNSWDDAAPEPAVLKAGMTEADLSNKGLGADGAIIIAAWISHKDNGALSLANVMGNCIGKEMLSKLQDIMRSKPNLVSLCGIADDATEADLSGLNMDADDAIILASELPDKRAMTSLNLADNGIGGYYTDKGSRYLEKFHPTPEGVVHTVAFVGPFLIPLSTFRRPSCYR